MSLPEGYGERGFDKKTCLHNVTGTEFDEHGFDIDGYRLDGYDREGYDRDGYDDYGYDRDGYDEDGYDRYVCGRDGYDRDGNDLNGFNKVGIHKTTKTKFDSYNFDVNGIHKITKTEFDPNGHDRDKCMEDDYRLEEYLKYYVDEREYDPEEPHDQDSEEESYQEVELSETSDIAESEAETGNISDKVHEEEGRK